MYSSNYGHDMEGIMKKWMTWRGGWTFLIASKTNELRGEEGGPSSLRRKWMNYTTRKADPPHRVKNKQITQWGGQTLLVALKMKENYTTRVHPPCRIENEQIMRRGGADPPCHVENTGIMTRGGWTLLVVSRSVYQTGWWGRGLGWTIEGSTWTRKTRIDRLFSCPGARKGGELGWSNTWTRKTQIDRVFLCPGGRERGSVLEGRVDLVRGNNMKNGGRTWYAHPSLRAPSSFSSPIVFLVVVVASHQRS